MKQRTNQSRVILIHGLASHRLLMMPLGWYLQRRGFSIQAFGYRSLLGRIEDHAERFRDFLVGAARQYPNQKIHIVAHSMGSIVTRQALIDRQIAGLGRIVMIAPPNHGSPVAASLSKNVIPICKTLAQLADTDGSYVRNLPDPEGLEIGIVAASRDRVIPKGNSSLDTQTDHVTLESGHNGLLIRPTAMKQVSDFLQHGRFTQTTDPRYSGIELSRDV